MQWKRKKITITTEFKNKSQLILLTLCWLLVSTFVAADNFDITPSCEAQNVNVKKIIDQASLKFEYIEGLQISYKIKYQTDSNYNFKKLLEKKSEEKNAVKEIAPLIAPQNFKSTVEGILIITTMDKTKKSVISIVKFEDLSVTLEINGVIDTYQAENIKKHLETELIIETTMTGLIKNVTVPKNFNQLSHGYIRAILGIMQFSLPEDGKNKKQWSLQEEDPNGTYIANYSKIKNLTDIVIQKTKQDYIYAEVENDEVEKAISSDTQVYAVLDQNRSGLKDLSGQENQSISFSGKKVAQVQSKITLKKITQICLQKSDFLILSKKYELMEIATQSISLSSNGISEEQQYRNFQLNELGEENLSSLIKHLNRFSNNLEPVFDEISLYLKFSALIYLQPDSTKSIGYILERSKIDSAEFQILLAALSNIGHKQAQQAIARSIIIKNKDIDSLLSLIPSLSVVKKPLKESQQVLRKLTIYKKNQDVRSAAILGLGIMADNLVNYDQSRSNSIVEWLISELKKSTEESYLQTILLALGNAENKESVKSIVDYNQTSNGMLTRMAAISALGAIETALSEAELINTLSASKIPELRNEALLAINRHGATKSIKSALITALNTEKIVDIQITILEQLAENYYKDTDVKQIIEFYADPNGSGELRQAAISILALKNK